jgi:hypothetical protein
MNRALQDKQLLVDLGSANEGRRKFAERVRDVEHGATARV